jgi:hypothetical protein
MTARKTIRILKVSVALVAIFIFATISISAWHHHDSRGDAQCPYCHLGHQTAAQPETSQGVALVFAICSLPLPEDSVLSVSPVFSNSPSRAPPSA